MADNRMNWQRLKKSNKKIYRGRADWKERKVEINKPMSDQLTESRESNVMSC